MLHGVDVSSHQGTVDWGAVAGAGIGFSFTKCTGGAWYVNPTFKANWEGIKAAGLVRGAYHYAFESSGQPFPGPGPEAEADFFLGTVLPLGISQGDMLVLDIEEGPHDVDLADWSLRWLKRVMDRVGFRPLLYTGRWFSDPHGFGRRPGLASFPLWLAQYQEELPSPPAPWDLIAFWQKSDSAQVAGVSGPCDLNELTDQAGPIELYGSPSTSEPVPPPVGPIYTPSYPSIAQNDDWSCAPTSARWALWSYSRQPSEQWLESSMLADGVVTTQQGLMDASGAGLADWLNREYGPAEFGGYVASNDGSVSFDEVAQEAATLKHPLCIGGRSWGSAGHWTGVRGYDGLKLLLANPAPGYGGITQTLSREQFEHVGPFSLVRLTNPASEAAVIPPPGPDPGPTPPWHGGVGSGLLEMMAADGTEPAQRSSTWLPLGVSPSDVETCYGKNATLYTWLLTLGKGFRYSPDP